MTHDVDYRDCTTTTLMRWSLTRTLCPRCRKETLQPEGEPRVCPMCRAWAASMIVPDADVEVDNV